MRQSKKLGVVVAVDGTLSNVGMYEMSNDTEQIWDGDILTGPKIGAFLTINQNDVKIIASVVTEKVIDQQNTIKSDEFDNRYRKNSINRIIQLKTRGVITEGKFEVTSSFVPMIGNEITLTSEEELKIIYSVEEDEATINIGSSILENQPIQLSINIFLRVILEFLETQVVGNQTPSISYIWNFFVQVLERRFYLKVSFLSLISMGNILGMICLESIQITKLFLILILAKKKAKIKSLFQRNIFLMLIF